MSWVGYTEAMLCWVGLDAICGDQTSIENEWVGDRETRAIGRHQGLDMG